MAANSLTPHELADRLFVTPNEAAAILQWDPRTVRKLIHDGAIPVTPGGGNSYRIPARWVLERARLTENLTTVEALEKRIAALESTLAKVAGVFGGSA